MLICFAGALCVLYMRGCGALDLCLAAHLQAQHDGLQGRRSFGKLAEAVPSAQPLLLNGDF